jgi:hypothetical protein
MKAVAQIKSANDAVKLVDANTAIPIEDSLYLYRRRSPPKRSTIGTISTSSRRSSRRTLFGRWTAGAVRS